MRFTYLDEAGKANLDHEPILVVAAVLVEPDKLWHSLNDFFHDLTEQCANHVGVELDEPLVISAKEVWSGEKFFGRKKWSVQERMRIFKQLCAVPQRFGLTVAFGAIKRDTNPDIPAEWRDQSDHAFAFLRAIRCVENYMKAKHPDESTKLFVEDAPKIKSIIEPIHRGYTSRTSEFFGTETIFKAKHVVEYPSFVTKKQSPLLQMADHCAFVIKRHLAGCNHITPYFGQIAPAIWDGVDPVTAFELSVPTARLRPAE